MDKKRRILSIDEYIEKLNAPVKASDNGLEEPLEKINRMFKSAIRKAPDHADELKNEWIKLKKKQIAGEITNLDYQIKEILSRFNVAFLSEGAEEEAKEIPGNSFNKKAKEIKLWVAKHGDDYNVETDHTKLIADILKAFKMDDKPSVEQDEFAQLVNINLE